MTPIVGAKFNLTRAGIHADGMLKNQEIYNIFDTDSILGCPPKVSITNTSGIAGVAYWINQYLARQNKPQVAKTDALVRQVYGWVMQQYEEGRITIISDEEMEEQVRRWMISFER